VNPLSGLHAVRTALEPAAAIDPFSLTRTGSRLFRSDRVTLAGIGTAAVLPLPDGLDDPAALDHIVRGLASVECDDRLDRGDRPAPPAPVVAFGALPFDRSAASALVVPQLTFGWDALGSAWCTVVTREQTVLPHSKQELAAWLSGAGIMSGPDHARPNEARNDVDAVGPRISDEAFEEVVAEAIAAIRRGEFDKVVLARQVEVAMAHAVDVAALLRRWNTLEPACTLFSMPLPEGQFVGASPELLVERSADAVHSRPLAGTAGRQPGDDAGVWSADLLDSRKDVREHQFVVEAITDALLPYCRDLVAPSRPEVVPLRSMTHLGTDIAGTLEVRADGSVPHVLELLAALHPTPAVGGVPTEVARAVIDRLEPESRGAYAGPVGFVDGAGDGQWVVGIRSMTLRGREARLVAGVGIVEGSEPRAERIETDLKLRAVLDALAPEAATPATASAGRARIS
jgi:isochorismate synthase